MPNFKKANLGTAADLKGQYEYNQGSKFLTLEVGKKGYKSNRIRIAPPHTNMESWFQPVWTHYSIGPTGHQRTIGCPRKMFDTDCPVCDAAFFLNDKGDKDGAKRYWPGIAYQMNVYKLNESNEIEDTTCYILSCGVGIFEQIWDEFEPNDAGQLTTDITDVEEGFNLVIKSKETDKKFNGKTVAEHKVTRIGGACEFPGDLDLLDELTDLTEMATYLEPSAAVALLTGKSDSPKENPWADESEMLEEGVVEGEFTEVEAEEVEDEDTEEDEEVEELDEESKEDISAAVAEMAKNALKKTNGTKAKPGPKPKAKTDTSNPSTAVADLQEFLNKKKAK